MPTSHDDDTGVDRPIANDDVSSYDGMSHRSAHKMYMVDLDESNMSALPDDNPKDLITLNEQPKKSTFRRMFIFLDYPMSTWFIMVNELCERFAFYGFKTILSLYLKNFLHFGVDSATSIVHAFVFFAYCK